MKIKNKEEIDISKFKFYKSDCNHYIIAGYKIKSSIYTFGIMISSYGSYAHSPFEGWLMDRFTEIEPKSEYYHYLLERINKFNESNKNDLKKFIYLIDTLIDLSQNKCVYFHGSSLISNKKESGLMFYFSNAYKNISLHHISNNKILKNCKNNISIMNSAKDILYDKYELRSMFSKLKRIL